MKKLLLVMAVFLIVGVANAVVWAPTDTDPNYPGAGVANWNVPANWDTLVLPTSVDKVQFQGDSLLAACVIDTAVVSGQTVIGDGNVGPAREVTILKSGTLTAYGTLTWTAAGYSRSGTINVERGGTFITEHRLGIGLVAAADPTVVSYFNINGGIAEIHGNLQIGSVNHEGLVSVNSGILEATGWQWRDTTGVWSFVDISRGALIIGGDVTVDIPDLITSGSITAYGGVGTVVYGYAGGKTTITASGDPQAYSPAMDSVVPVGSPTLSWDNLAAGVWVDVWFGTDVDALVKIVNAVADQTSTFVSAPVFDEYVWRVDTYINDPATDPNVIEGETMYFVASDDQAPEVAMDTLPTATWKNEPVQLDITVTDDGKSPLTFLWESSDPNAVFSPNNYVEDPTVSFDYAALEVTVTVTVGDSNPLYATDFASVGIYCPANPCLAARRPLGLNLAGDHPADITADCRLDYQDFAEIGEEWLDEYAITETQPLP